MIMCFLEIAINAKVTDVLDFLERENRFIHPYNHLSDKPDGEDITVNFCSKRNEDKIAISTKIYTTRAGTLFPKCYLDAPDGQGNEVIRFEVTRLTDTRSLIKGLYVEGNSVIELMFLKRLERLMIAFETKLPEQYRLRVEELEKEERKLGWIDSPQTLFGNEVRYYSKLPKQSKKQKSDINASSSNVASVEGNIVDSTVISGNNNVVHHTVITFGQSAQKRKTKKTK